MAEVLLDLDDDVMVKPTLLQEFPEQAVWTANTMNLAMSYYEDPSLTDLTAETPLYQCEVQTGSSNYETRFYKRVIRAFVYFFSRYKLHLRVYADGRENTQALDKDTPYIEKYEVPSRQQLKLSEPQRVKIAKGIQGDNWSFVITNPKGKFFQLQKIELAVVPIRISHG